MQNTKRNLNIEGLRGIGLLMVVVFHLFFRYQELYVDTSLSFFGFDSLGFLGVCIFLLFSSYFLSAKPKGDKYSILAFLKKKILRLWPEYFVGIVIIFFTVNLSPLPIDKPNYLDLLSNTFFVNGFIGQKYIDGAHWYITILLGMTIVFSALHKFRLTDKWFVYLIWLGCSAVLLKVKIPVLPLLLGGGYVGIICIGAAIYNLKQRHEKMDCVFWGTTIAASIGYLVISKSIMQLVCVFIAALLVLFAINTKTKFLSNRVLVFLGTVSYAVYIIHQNISYVIEYYLTGLFGSYNLFIPFIALVAALLLGTGLYYLIFAVRKKLAI